MKKHELILIAELLEMAADKFSNHGCNDFDVSDVLDTPLAEEIVQEVFKDDEEPRPEHLKTYAEDWILMLHFAKKLRRLADER